MAYGDRPDYVLSIRRKDGNQRTLNAGALFKNRYGYTLVLNPGVVLDWRMMEDCWLNLNAPDDEPRAPAPGRGRSPHHPAGPVDRAPPEGFRARGPETVSVEPFEPAPIGDDDIPF